MIRAIVNSVVYAGLGCLLLVGMSYVLDWLTPGKLWDEICQKQNQPLAIVMAAYIIAIGMIVAVAIH